MNVVEVELAGVDPEGVVLDIDGRVLELRGVRQAPAAAGRAYRHAAIARGPFALAIDLGAEVDADACRAGYTDGILRVELPLLPGAG